MTETVYYEAIPTEDRNIRNVIIDSIHEIVNAMRWAEKWDEEIQNKWDADVDAINTFYADPIGAGTIDPDVIFEEWINLAEARGFYAHQEEGMFSVTNEFPLNADEFVIEWSKENGGFSNLSENEQKAFILGVQEFLHLFPGDLDENYGGYTYNEWKQETNS